MVAYWVNTFVAVHDPEKVAAYAALAGPAMTAAGGRFLARGAPAAALEGELRERTTLIAFPDVDTALAAYRSPAYQEALRALGDGAEREIQILRGLDDASAD